MRQSSRENPPGPNLRTMVGAMLVVLVLGSVWAVFFNSADEPVADSDAAGGEPVATSVASGDTTAAGDGDPAADPEDATATSEPAVDDEAVASDDIEVTTTVTLPADPLEGLALQVVAEGLQQPTSLTTPPGEDREFVLERLGRIRIIDEGGLVEASWLNLTDRVLADGIEQGLLGVAFHPEYDRNGRLFVYYTNKEGRRTLSEFLGGPDAGDPNSEKVLFSLPQPPNSADIRHYGGMLQFGPDGYLYVSLGDGADSRGQGQNPDTFYASILRLDVDSGEEPYGIPPDNPFVDGGGAPEVWAYGLRNPWRFWIDPVDELLYVADVGQGDREEVNVVSITEGGYNFGWANVEGTRCFFESGCDPSDYVVPIVEYGHNLDDPDEGCSVTGGILYRGQAIPELHGHYFYADWCTQWLKSVVYADGLVVEATDWTEQLGEVGQVNAMGIDEEGELYLVTFEGIISKFVPIR